MNWLKNKILNSGLFFVTFGILILSVELFAQGPPAPPPAPIGVIPWGPTEIFAIMVMGYGIKKMLKRKR